MLPTFTSYTLSLCLRVIQGFDADEFLTYAFFFPKGYGVGLIGTYAVLVVGRGHAVPTLQMGGRGQVSSSGLVAELSIGASDHFIGGNRT